MKLIECNTFEKLLFYSENKRTNINIESYPYNNKYEICDIIKSYETPIGFIDKYCNVYIVDNNKHRLFTQTTTVQIATLLKNFDAISQKTFKKCLRLLQVIGYEDCYDLNIGRWDGKLDEIV